MKENKVLLFDYDKIEAAADGKSLEMVRILRMLTNKQIPRDKFDPIYKYSTTDFSGESFLVNPEMLLHDAYKYTYQEVCLYVAIASLRLFTDWATTGNARLPVIAVPLSTVTVIQAINASPIMGILGTDIIFKYEEPEFNTIN